MKFCALLFFSSLAFATTVVDVSNQRLHKLINFDRDRIKEKGGNATIDVFGQARLFNGTSAAAPVIAGIAALIAQKYHSKSGVDLKELVLAHSVSDPFLHVDKGRSISLHAW
jgi:hypothetical protein